MGIRIEEQATKVRNYTQQEQLQGSQTDTTNYEQEHRYEYT